MSPSTNKQTASRNILVTSALPYANGPIHIGHLVEYIQTDIWVRFQRLCGNTCYYVCADDAHGTPIMLSAQKKGISPETLIDEISREHRADFAGFHIGFDNYHTTHSEENRQYAEMIYARLQERGHIFTRSIFQSFDPEKEIFLPDRFIRGTCPRCGAKDQYGDNCEICGATYSPSELQDPVSVLSGATPVEKESEHYFVRLSDFADMLKSWVNSHKRYPAVQPEIANKLEEWLEGGLKDWDISRDAPYFGFEIPDVPGKYFYVWLDAPIGYMASFQNFCNREGIDFDAFWGRDSNAELYHFIGKDIAYFHTLFWPAQLFGAGFRTPSAVFCHGFLTVDGQKMSKSRGTFIEARTYLNHLHPDYLRYYFACKLTSGIDDIDLNPDDFIQRVNSDLVGKVVNIASRCAGFITKRFDGHLSRMQAAAQRVVCVGGGDTSIDVVSVARRMGHIQTFHPNEKAEDFVHGFVAYDAATAAKAEGANVTLTSLFKKEEMTASEHEVHDAMTEGVTILDGVMPLEVLLDGDGRARALKMSKCTVDGKGVPTAIEGTEFEIECNLVVSAIGQGGDLSGLEELDNGRGFISADGHYQVSGRSGHFAAGDIIRPHLLTTAIGQASVAAQSIDSYLKGEALAKRPKVDAHHFNLLSKLREAGLEPKGYEAGQHLGTCEADWAIHNFEDRSAHEVVHAEELFLGYFDFVPRNVRAEDVPSAEDVLGHFKERLICLSEEETVAEAKRCMSCGMCFECDNCVIFCPQDAISRVKKNKSTTGRYVDTDYSRCVGCHICADVCPTGYIDMGLGE